MIEMSIGLAHVETDALKKDPRLRLFAITIR